FGSAFALLANPSETSAMPAIPAPNFFSAPRRVTDRAIPLANSSNLWFITSFMFVLFFLAELLSTATLIPGGNFLFRANHTALCLAPLNAREVVRRASIVTTAVIAIPLAGILAEPRHAYLMTRAVRARDASPASLGLACQTE